MEKSAEYYPLTHPQKSVWFTEKLHPGTSIGNVAGTLRIKEEVDPFILEKAINIFIKKNDSMRLRIVEVDGEPKQYLSKYEYYSFDFFDFSGKDLNELYKWDALQTRTPFELIESNLFYFAIIKVSERDSGFYIKCHHLISDAWSMSLLGSQVMSYYSTLKKENEISEDNNPSYIDFIISEEEYKKSDRLRRDKEYWNKTFESFPDKTVIKAGDLDNISIKARRKTMVTPKKLTAKIYQYCSENRTSVFSLFIAALSMYINRVTANEDIILGTTTLNRLNPKEKVTAGMFNNIAPMRININDEMDFKSLIDGVSSEGLKLLRHQKYPYDLILKEVREKHKISENIFNIILIYQNSKFSKDNLTENYATRWHFNGYQVDSLHISINDRENEGHLIIDYDYQTDLFHAKEIDFIHQNIINVLWHALDNPTKKISKLEMLSEKEKYKILNEFNKSKIIYPEGLKQVFEEQGKKVPEKVKYYILDKNLNLLPIGIAGELYISGAKLTARKLNAFGLSDKMAIPNPYAVEGVLYRSGYIARWFPDGDIMYLGSAVSHMPMENSEEGKKKEEVKVDIISTFTAEPVEGYIKWWGEKFRFNLKTGFAGYNQVFQELLNPNSMLSENIDGINVALIRFEDFIRYDNGTDETKLLILERTFEELKEALGRFGNKVPLVIAVFPVSTHLGLSDILRQKIAKINEDFIKLLTKIKNVFILDFNELQVLYSIQDVFDSLRDKEGHMPFSEEYYAAMGTEVTRKICAIKRQDFKVIVLDCDNTLWKGICGEQGSLNVQVTDSYRQLQQFMLQKYNEGMLLAVCSKNNESDVFEVFDQNTGMILNKEHIVNWKINWKEKSTNIKEIASELNLGLDSFIFIDDDSLECSKMIENCPEVLTLQLPSEEKYLPLFLKHVWAFDRVRVTNEDVLRNSMYEAEKKRKEFRDKNISLKSFMKSLQLKVSMRVIGENEIERAAQLTQRTNQFNLSTIRRDEDEIARLLNDSKTECFVVEASDKFGDYGIIGLVILKDDGEKLFLDTLLMSCRIFGRNVEDALLAGIGRYAREISRQNIEAIFVSTEKNMPVQDFIKRMKWVLIEETEKQKKYRINIEDQPESIEHIEFYYKEMYVRSIKNIERNGGMHSSFYSYEKPNKSEQKRESDIIELESYNIEKLMLSKHNDYILPLYYINAQKLLCIPLFGDNNYKIGIQNHDNETETEKKLLIIWKDILKNNTIGIDSEFFEIGGDSLCAVLLISRIFKEFSIELTLRDLFESSNIRKLAQKLMTFNKSDYKEIVTTDKKDYYVVSSSQKRMYILNELEKSTNYNMPIALLFHGNIDLLKLENVFKEIINRHESFRTSFHIEEGVLIQKILDKVDFSIEKQNSIFEKFDIKSLTEPFELDKAPLLRVKLLDIGKNETLMLIDMHHIISDGASLKIFFDELVTLYRGEILDKIKIQYKDYSEWEFKRINGNVLYQQQEYWSKVYNDNIPVLDMPLDFKRKEKQTFNGNVIEFIIPEKEIYNLKNVSDNISLNSIIFALYTILLNKYTNQDDIVIGSIVAGRTHTSVDKIIGNFTNFLPIRIKVDEKESYINNLYSITRNLIEAYQNQEYPFEKIVEDTGVQFDMSRNPMFDTAIVFHNEFESNIFNKNIELNNVLSLELYDMISINSTIDIKLDVFIQDKELKCLFQYNTNLFTSNTIHELINHLHMLINAIIKSPYDAIENISIQNNVASGISNYNKITDGIKSIQIRKKSGTTDIYPNKQIYKTKSVLESQIINLLEVVMKKSCISIDDNIFKLGGDSLTAIIVISRIAKEFNVELSVNDLFIDNTAQKLARKIIELKKTEFHEIKRAPLQEYYELTSAQKRMYLLSQIEKDGTSYNECYKIEIKGNVDKYKLENAFKKVILRHEILRTGFEYIDGNLVQKVYEDIDFNINYIKPHKNEIQSIIRDFVKAFDLSAPPLIRVTMLKADEENHILLFDIHHIIIDGTSMGILLNELIAIYENKTLNPLKLQYKDFANWQCERNKSSQLEKQEKYWIEQFKSEIPILNLPTDYNRPIKKSFKGEKEYFILEHSIVEKLNTACSETGTTLFMVLFAAFNVLLFKYSGQQDIVVGTPVTGRSNIDTQNIIGMFVNSLPLRTKPYGHDSFYDYLNAVKEIVVNSLKNQDYQYDMLVEKLKTPKDRSRNPLFDVMFVLQNIDIPNLVLEGMEIKQCRYGNNGSKFDLYLSATKKSNELLFELEYSTELFKTETIKRMIGHYLKIINEILDNPKKLISDIDVLGLEEKNDIIFNFNTAYLGSKTRTIQQLFEEQVQRTPNRIAVKFDGMQLTYKELNAKANQLARVLRAKGVKNDCVVGIMLNRSIDLVIGILGIIKSGGAYLPVDPNYPKERIKLILKDSGARILITTRNLTNDVVLNYEKVFINDACIYSEDTSNVKNVNVPNDLLYVVFTSGTTGKPKGVMIEHKNLINLIMHQFAKNDINYKCNILQFASMSFDVYSQELFSALLAGGTLHILSNEDKKNVMSMYDFIKKSNISIMYLPTAFFKFIMNNMIYLSIAPECVEHIIVAGEKLTLTPDFKQYLCQSGISLHNHYGPAETHVVTTYTIKNEEDFSEVPFIGKPISNTQIYILDKYLKVQPIGAYGEIYIAGESVGRGYIGNDLLTSERFVFINVLDKQIRTYKTGDIGRWTKDGNIEFLGRADNQVKIRGYRIELEEIETYFLKHDKIKECTIMLHNFPNDRKELVAYYTASDIIITGSLQKFLREFLPAYMIPKYFVQIDKMPLNQNGKINKDILQTYFDNRNKVEIVDKPTNREEEILVDIWRTVLDIDDVGINDDFFDIGGDSLLTIKVVLEASKRGLKFSIRDLYNYPTVKELNKYVMCDNYSEVI